MIASSLYLASPHIMSNLRTLLLVSTLISAKAWSWDSLSEATAELHDCGSENNAAFKLIFHKITQNESDIFDPSKLADISIMYANDYMQYDDVQVDFKYWLNSIPMPTQTEDACAHGLICPQIVGEHQVSREIKFPTMPGKTKAEILWKSGDTTLLCIRAMIFIPVLNIFRWR